MLYSVLPREGWWKAFWYSVRNASNILHAMHSRNTSVICTQYLQVSEWQFKDVQLKLLIGSELATCHLLACHLLLSPTLTTCHLVTCQIKLLAQFIWTFLLKVLLSCQAIRSINVSIYSNWFLKLVLWFSELRYRSRPHLIALVACVNRHCENSTNSI